MAWADIANGESGANVRAKLNALGAANDGKQAGSAVLTAYAAGASPTAAFLTLADDADTTAMRATLDLVIGVSGNVVPKTNGAAVTWAAGAAFGGVLTAGTGAAAASVAINGSNAAGGYITTQRNGVPQTLIGDTIAALGSGAGLILYSYAGTGPVVIYPEGGLAATISTTRFSINGALSKPAYTVATLPTPTTGDERRVTDALSPVFGSTVVGGGAVNVPVFYNGTNWIVG